MDGAPVADCSPWCTHVKGLACSMRVSEVSHRNTTMRQLARWPATASCKVKGSTIYTVNSACEPLQVLNISSDVHIFFTLSMWDVVNTSREAHTGASGAKAPKIRNYNI
jgi:hypothetical protein